MRTWRFVFLATVLLNTLSLKADSDPHARDSLKGIKAFSVLVENLDQDGFDLGLSVSQLQTAIELKLRLASVKVVTNEESLALPGAPYLYARVLIVGKSPGIIGYYVELKFEQIARLERDPKTNVLFVVTWSTGFAGTVGSAKAAESIKQSVADATDTFLNAYLSVNPK